MSQRDLIELDAKNRERRVVVAKLLAAAEQMADGLVRMLDHVYDLDSRTSDALAAANNLAVVISNEQEAAEDRCVYSDR